MKCLCEKGTQYQIKVEADIAADPLWCFRCGYNLELEELPISPILQTKLTVWAMQYGNWIDWEKDCLLPDAFMLEQQHNEAGLILTGKLEKELGDTFKVAFFPSNMARADNGFPY